MPKLVNQDRTQADPSGASSGHTVTPKVFDARLPSEESIVPSKPILHPRRPKSAIGRDTAQMSRSPASYPSIHPQIQRPVSVISLSSVELPNERDSDAHASHSHVYHKISVSPDIPRRTTDRNSRPGTLRTRPSSSRSFSLQNVPIPTSNIDPSAKPLLQPFTCLSSSLTAQIYDCNTPGVAGVSRNGSVRANMPLLRPPSQSLQTQTFQSPPTVPPSSVLAQPPHPHSVVEGGGDGAWPDMWRGDGHGTEQDAWSSEPWHVGWGGGVRHGDGDALKNSASMAGSMFGGHWREEHDRKREKDDVFSGKETHFRSFPWERVNFVDSEAESTEMGGAALWDGNASGDAGGGGWRELMAERRAALMREKLDIGGNAEMGMDEGKEVGEMYDPENSQIRNFSGRRGKWGFLSQGSEKVDLKELQRRYEGAGAGEEEENSLSAGVRGVLSALGMDLGVGVGVAGRHGDMGARSEGGVEGTEGGGADGQGVDVLVMTGIAAELGLDKLAPNQKKIDTKIGLSKKNRGAGQVTPDPKSSKEDNNRRHDGGGASNNPNIDTNTTATTAAAAAPSPAACAATPNHTLQRQNTADTPLRSALKGGNNPKNPISSENSGISSSAKTLPGNSSLSNIPNNQSTSQSEFTPYSENSLYKEDIHSHTDPSVLTCINTQRNILRSGLCRYSALGNYVGRGGGIAVGENVKGSENGDERGLENLHTKSPVGKITSKKDKSGTEFSGKGEQVHFEVGTEDVEEAEDGEDESAITGSRRVRFPRMPAATYTYSPWTTAEIDTSLNTSGELDAGADASAVIDRAGAVMGVERHSTGAAGSVADESGSDMNADDADEGDGDLTAEERRLRASAALAAAMLREREEEAALRRRLAAAAATVAGGRGGGGSGGMGRLSRTAVSASRGGGSGIAGGIGRGATGYSHSPVGEPVEVSVQGSSECSGGGVGGHARADAGASRSRGGSGGGAVAVASIAFPQPPSPSSTTATTTPKPLLLRPATGIRRVPATRDDTTSDKNHAGLRRSPTNGLRHSPNMGTSAARRTPTSHSDVRHLPCMSAPTAALHTTPSPAPHTPASAQRASPSASHTSSGARLTSARTSAPRVAMVSLSLTRDDHGAANIGAAAPSCTSAHVDAGQRPTANTQRRVTSQRLGTVQQPSIATRGVAVDIMGRHPPQLPSPAQASPAPSCPVQSPMPPSETQAQLTALKLPQSLPPTPSPQSPQSPSPATLPTGSLCLPSAVALRHGLLCSVPSPYERTTQRPVDITPRQVDAPQHLEQIPERLVDTGEHTAATLGAAASTPHPPAATPMRGDEGPSGSLYNDAAQQTMQTSAATPPATRIDTPSGTHTIPAPALAASVPASSSPTPAPALPPTNPARIRRTDALLARLKRLTDPESGIASPFSEFPDQGSGDGANEVMSNKKARNASKSGKGMENPKESGNPRRNFVKENIFKAAIRTSGSAMKAKSEGEMPETKKSAGEVRKSAVSSAEGYVGVQKAGVWRGGAEEASEGEDEGEGEAGTETGASRGIQAGLLGDMGVGGGVGRVRQGRVSPATAVLPDDSRVHTTSTSTKSGETSAVCHPPVGVTPLDLRSLTHLRSHAATDISINGVEADACVAGEDDCGGGGVSAGLCCPSRPSLSSPSSQAARARLLLELAHMHHTRAQITYYGWRPWKIFLEKQRVLERRAAGFRKKSVFRKMFRAWNSRMYTQREEIKMLEEEHHRQALALQREFLLRRGIRALHLNLARRQKCAEMVTCIRRKVDMQVVFYSWMNLTAQKQEFRCQRVTERIPDAQRKGDLCIQRHAFFLLRRRCIEHRHAKQRALQEEQEKEEKLKKKEAAMREVLGWLQNSVLGPPKVCDWQGSGDGCGTGTGSALGIVTGMRADIARTPATRGLATVASPILQHTHADQQQHSPHFPQPRDAPQQQPQATQRALSSAPHPAPLSRPPLPPPRSAFARQLDRMGVLDTSIPLNITDSATDADTSSRMGMGTPNAEDAHASHGWGPIPTPGGTGIIDIGGTVDDVATAKKLETSGRPYALAYTLPLPHTPSSPPAPPSSAAASVNATLGSDARSSTTPSWNPKTLSGSSGGVFPGSSLLIAPPRLSAPPVDYSDIIAATVEKAMQAVQQQTGCNPGADMGEGMHGSGGSNSGSGNGTDSGDGSTGGSADNDVALVSEGGGTASSYETPLRSRRQPPSCSTRDSGKTETILEFSDQFPDFSPGKDALGTGLSPSIALHHARRQENTGISKQDSGKGVNVGMSVSVGVGADGGRAASTPTGTGTTITISSRTVPVHPGDIRAGPSTSAGSASTGTGVDSAVTGINIINNGEKQLNREFNDVRDRMKGDARIIFQKK